MSDKYISQEAIKNALVDKFKSRIGASRIPTWNDALDAVTNLPAADVVEVRHGRWHMFSKGSGSYNGVITLSDAFQCTVCKESFWNKSNYCPSCGAKMDGGQDDV